MSDPVSTPSLRLQRILVIFSVALTALFVLFAAAIASINLVVFSASSFVEDFFSALARHDVQYALSMPGVDVHSKDSPFLQPNALPTISAISVESSPSPSSAIADDISTVTARFTADGTAVTAAVRVRKDGSFGGLFTRWEFADSPLGTVTVRVDNADTFRVGSQEADVTAYITDYAAFSPMLYTVSHASTLLTADPQSVLLASSGQDADVTVTAGPNDAFLDAVQTQVSGFLSSCATQQSLAPASCPFATTILNRLEGLPKWQIVQMPTVSLSPDGDQRWRIADCTGTARVTGTIRSLYDGSLSTLDRTITFSIGYVVTADGSTITVHYRG